MRNISSMAALLLLLTVGVALAWEQCTLTCASDNSAGVYLTDDPNDPNEPNPQPEMSPGDLLVFRLLEEDPNEPNDPQPESI